jgi:phosphocarrier protein
MPRAEAEIVNKLGLHARASAKLCQLAGSYPCEVWMERGSRRINAKSIMGVMMLAAGKGATVIVDTEGERADEALAELLKLIAGRFGEAE